MTAGFASLVMEAKRLADHMGTWPFHEAARAPSHLELVGWIRYTASGLEKAFEHAKQRALTADADGAERKKEWAERQQAKARAQIGQWRRLCRWMLLVKPEQAPAIAEAVLRQLDGIAFYVPCGHPYLTEDDEAPRASGRPRLRPKALDFTECGACHGLGYM